MSNYKTLSEIIEGGNSSEYDSEEYSYVSLFTDDRTINDRGFLGFLSPDNEESTDNTAFTYNVFRTESGSIDWVFDIFTPDKNVSIRGYQYSGSRVDKYMEKLNTRLQTVDRLIHELQNLRASVIEMGNEVVEAKKIAIAKKDAENEQSV